MKVFNSIELIDLGIYTDKTLIFTDFHIGYEEALNKQGLLVPRFQFPEIIERLDSIFSKLKNKKIDRIIVNGDIKHEFGTISDQEWRHTLKLLDYLGQHCKEVILIKGNHDTILGPIAKKRNVRVVDHFSINNTLTVHGHKIPDKNLLKKSKIIIIGHEHPAVSIREGPRTELFKAYLIGKWKNKKLIVQPSFNLVTEGTDVMKEELLSPFLKQNLGNFDVIVAADKMYRFGKLREL
jgi:putative SbcD/Mre11-related phosphoesterase